MDQTSAIPTEKRCAVVTGANKGIGLEICRQLASNGVNVVLTARNESKGTEAVEKLRLSGLSDVIFHQLDVKDPTSIACLAKFIATRFNKLNILVNNAAESGIIIHDQEFRAFKDGAGFLEVIDENAHLLSGVIEQSYDMGEGCLKTNYYGAKLVTEAFLPLLQNSKSPRIVNVSSDYGKLEWIPSEVVRSELQNLHKLTEDKIDEVLERFLWDFKEDKLRENGWPITVSAYKMSKVALNAYTRLLAKKFPRFLVNSVHPGYVLTDMTSNTGLLTPEEGAKGPVMLALLPDGSPSGLFFYQTDVLPF